MGPSSLGADLAVLQELAVHFRGTVSLRMMAQISASVVMWHAEFNPGPKRRKVSAFADTPAEAARELLDKLDGWRTLRDRLQGQLRTFASQT